MPKASKSTHCTLGGIHALITARGYDYSRRSVKRALARAGIEGRGPSTHRQFYAAAAVKRWLDETFPKMPPAKRTVAF